MGKISEFLTINQNKIEILQKGQNGTPIIILTGMGCSFDEWYEVTESLSKSNRVIMFHRPGLGASEISHEVRNTQTVVNEVSEMIRLLKLSEPVVLVGHSYGGLCVQHFVKEYPEKVAGIVLVDSTSVDLKVLDDLNLPVLNEGSTDEIWMEKCRAYSQMKREELRGIINPTLTEKQKLLPNDIQKRLINFQINPSLYKAMYSEISNWKRDGEIIKNLKVYPDIPLIVISRDEEYTIRLGTMEGLPEWELRLFEEKWQELMMNQVNLTLKSKFHIAQEASHSIHLDRPDIIVQSINEINSLFN
ncbi:alpha/beta fold hydrolase [Lysinibacillus sp. NPDC097214]|uniref:alpha/beta fold hydrolase n=1 Tax=Lysinibacillus sp. NPDC097214 TaxID=3390584 RepID=UPI003CFE93F9